jgi:hypothetical protein
MQCPLCKQPKVQIIKLFGEAADALPSTQDAGYESDSQLDAAQLRSKLSHSKRRQAGLAEKVVDLAKDLDEERKKYQQVSTRALSSMLCFSVLWRDTICLQMETGLLFQLAEESQKCKSLQVSLRTLGTQLSRCT